jgi:hypothetical protein
VFFLVVVVVVVVVVVAVVVVAAVIVVAVADVVVAQTATAARGTIAWAPQFLFCQVVPVALGHADVSSPVGHRVASAHVLGALALFMKCTATQVG